MITKFNGENFYLSNFFMVPVEYKGFCFSNNEAAFQAQKATNQHDFVKIACSGPVQARNVGRTIKIRPDWENVKDQIMYEIVKAKFVQNPFLAEKLLNTGKRPLEEGNTWDDVYWGTVNGKGLNKLGKILMQVREELSISLEKKNQNTLPEKKKAIKKGEDR